MSLQDQARKMLEGLRLGELRVLRQRFAAEPDQLANIDAEIAKRRADGDPAHGRARPGPMRHPECLCGARGLRDEKHDAYYCPESGTWLEEACDDPKCAFCLQRPEIKKVSP